MKKLVFLFLLLIISPLALFAQEVEMADNFRAEGKIYVVVAIVLIILIGLFAYLFFLDKKVTELEKRVRDQQTK
jgi:CcmD family protein